MFYKIAAGRNHKQSVVTRVHKHIFHCTVTHWASTTGLESNTSPPSGEGLPLFTLCPPEFSNTFSLLSEFLRHCKRTLFTFFFPELLYPCRVTGRVLESIPAILGCSASGPYLNILGTLYLAQGYLGSTLKVPLADIMRMF